MTGLWINSSWSLCSSGDLNTLRCQRDEASRHGAEQPVTEENIQSVNHLWTYWQVTCSSGFLSVCFCNIYLPQEVVVCCSKRCVLNKTKSILVFFIWISPCTLDTRHGRNVMVAHNLCAFVPLVPLGRGALQPLVAETSITKTNRKVILTIVLCSALHACNKSETIQ